MFKNILIVESGKKSKKHKEVLVKVMGILKNNLLLKSSSELVQSDFDNIDLVLTIGGDGTFIKASHFIEGIPILGINSEPEFSEGALKSLKENELDQLENMINGKFKILERERIKIKLNNKIIDKHAINEIYIGAAKQFHTSRYKIKFKNKSEEQRSSGVIVVTGSGSNAWYKSAGGTPFNHNEKKLAFLVREPYFGNLFKPTMIQGEISLGEKIEFISKKHEEGIIAIDSNVIFDFNEGDIVEIEISDKPLKVLIKQT